MECMHDLRPDPEVSPPEIPPKLTPGRRFDKLWPATTGSPKVWSVWRALEVVGPDKVCLMTHRDNCVERQEI